MKLIVNYDVTMLFYVVALLLTINFTLKTFCEIDACTFKWSGCNSYVIITLFANCGLQILLITYVFDIKYVQLKLLSW